MQNSAQSFSWRSDFPAIPHQKVNAYLKPRNVQLFYERVAATDVANVNMLTRRIIGFGGRINAAPFLVPQCEWVEVWKKMREQVP